MTITVIIEAKTKNFKEWNMMFNSLEEQRQKAGIYFNAYQNQDALDTSFVIGTAPSKEVFLEFFNSPERTAIQRSKIIDDPRIIFLNSV